MDQTTKDSNHNDDAENKNTGGKKRVERVSWNDLGQDDYKSSLLDTRPAEHGTTQPNPVALPWTSLRYKILRTTFIVLGHASMVG